MIMDDLMQTSVAAREFLAANLRRMNKRRTKYSMADYTGIADRLASIVSFVSSEAGALMGETDLQQFQETSRALSLKTASHIASDETGAIGYPEGAYVYSREEVLYVARFYRYTSKFGAPLDTSASIPRGKNTGYPEAVSGSNRALNNAAMVAHAESASRFKRAWGSQATLSNYRQEIEQRVGGGAVMFYGERLQHTSKKLPCFLSDGFIEQSDVEMRVRMINMSPKFAVLYNRINVKQLLRNVVMNSPLHPSDKVEINNRVMAAMRKGWKIAALDQSKFDFRHGMPRLQSIIDVITEIAGPSVSADLEAEARIPLWYPLQNTYKIDETIPILPSGISWTTVANCIGSALALHAAMGHKYRLTDLGSSWDAMAWGDDLLVMAPDLPEEDVIHGWYENIRCDVTFEPNVRYLGFIYDKGYASYARYRLFQTLLPERVADPALYKLGAVTKADMYKFPDREKAIKAFIKCNNEVKGERYELEYSKLIVPFHDNEYVKEGIKRANEVAAEMSVLDDVIYRMTSVVTESEAYAVLGISEGMGPWVSISQAKKEIDPEVLADIEKDPLGFIVRLAGPERLTPTGMFSDKDDDD